MPTGSGRKESISARPKKQRRTHSAVELDRLIAEALVDAYGDEEQRTASYTMLEEHLTMPFKTEVLGVEVTVQRVDLTDDEQIGAVCTSGKLRQTISLLALPLPDPQPRGVEWIEAYRRWARGGTGGGD